MTINNQRLIVETIWWLVTALIIVLIMTPIWRSTNNYPFTAINIIFILCAITFFRHIFFLRYSPIVRLQYLKLAIIFLAIPAIFLLIQNLNSYITHLDDYSYEGYLGHLSINDQKDMASYIKSQMVFFGAASIITGIALPFRMVASIWRLRNKGRV